MFGMDFSAIYHFLFETYAGIGVLIGASQMSASAA